MTKIKVVDYTNLPGKITIIQTIVALLALDYWNAAQWLYGAVGVFLVVSWIVNLAKIFTQEKVKLFDKDND